MKSYFMAGPERIELPTRSFGDSRSTTELWSYISIDTLRDNNNSNVKIKGCLSLSRHIKQKTAFDSYFDLGLQGFEPWTRSLRGSCSTN